MRCQPLCPIMLPRDMCLNPLDVRAAPTFMAFCVDDDGDCDCGDGDDDDDDDHDHDHEDTHIYIYRG